MKSCLCIALAAVLVVRGSTQLLGNEEDIWSRYDDETVDDHWEMDKNGPDIGEALSNKEDLDLDNRILHCPPDSAVRRDTIHNEEYHAYVNYLTKTCLFSFLITTGLLLNIFLLSVTQDLMISPTRTAIKAELAAICAYLATLIPVYPVAYSYAYTGHFEQYEFAKPYVTTFFQACADITEALTIWTFLWLHKIRAKFVVSPEMNKKANKKDAEKLAKESLSGYVSTTVRDELRLVVALVAIVNLPKYFDTEIKVESDPCNPEKTIVVRQANVLGRAIGYVFGYRLFVICSAHYLIPLFLMGKYTYMTHKALRESELPAEETKEQAIRDKSRTDDGLTTELDLRIILFYVLYLPNAFYNVASFVEYLLPSSNEGYFEVTEVISLTTRLLVTIHAAYVPFFCYMLMYKAFREKAKSKYWDRLIGIYQEYKRRKQLALDFKLFEERLNAEMEQEKTAVAANPPVKENVGKSLSAPVVTAM